LVVIDESHHFRNPHTRRYRHLAPWLVGQTVLLVTATPIVNRGSDLAHQLLLAIRDDALAMDGVISLRAMLGKGTPAHSLGQLVFEHGLVSDRRPSRVRSSSVATDVEHRTLCRTIDQLGRLRLSTSVSIASLIRGVFLRAAASSPAALGGTLRRYRRLLLHARDACQAGQALSRGELKRLTGELNDQLVFWELLQMPEGACDLDLGDLAQLDDLIAQAEASTGADDAKVVRLRHLLADDRPTLIFTSSRDTVRYLRERLAGRRIAWCTGARAGIGTQAVPRSSVLGWFREPTSVRLAPLHLVVTDVAAEGLDLQRAARVIHYDLPWTPMRIEQREGRSVRYGSPHAEVEVVEFRLPAPLERRLKIEATLARKVKLPGTAGLGPEGRHVWRWRMELADRFRGPAALNGVACVPYRTSGLLAGFGLYLGRELVAATVLWMEPSGSWTEAPDVIEARLATAAIQHGILEQSTGELRRWLALLSHPLHERLVGTRSRRWIAPEPTAPARQVMQRLQRLIQIAARRHQPQELARLEGAMSFVVGGHTAGEAALIERLAQAPDAMLISRMPRLPAARLDWGGLEVRLVGLVLFGPLQASMSRIVSSPCPDFRPPSSTSTVP
jgi:hypothetical protein